MNPEKYFYFGYGSNLLQSQMKERCPESVFLSVGYIKEYKFIYDGYAISRNGAVANVIPSGNSVVWGAIYEVSQDDLKRLDGFEGYPTEYQREKIEVFLKDGTTVLAYMYYRKGKKPGISSEEYRNIVVKGAQECGLPEEYINNYLKI